MRNTRMHKANELFNTLKKGPELSIDAFGVDGVTLSTTDRLLLKAYFIKNYRLWSESWIIPNVVELVPELKGRERP